MLPVMSAIVVVPTMRRVTFAKVAALMMHQVAFAKVAALMMHQVAFVRVAVLMTHLAMIVRTRATDFKPPRVADGLRRRRSPEPVSGFTRRL